MFNTLQQIIDAKKDISIDDLNEPENKSAALELQSRLCDLGILDPVFDGDKSTSFGPVAKGDGKIGPNSKNALFEFCRLAGIGYIDGLLSIKLLKELVKAQPDKFLPLKIAVSNSDDLGARLAKRILRYLQRKHYWIARSPNMYNIVYVEGMNPDGSLNNDAFNEWNDRRIVIRINDEGKPLLLVNEQATTEPGRFYTDNPLHPQGAARIAFGQYKAWGDGLHRGVQPALVQQGMVRVHRDKNKDGKRSASDPIDVGDTFGINQHSTDPDYTPIYVGKYSAGCLVGRRYRFHMAFLSTVKKDVRYTMNKRYLFVTAVIAGDDLAKLEPQ